MRFILGSFAMLLFSKRLVDEGMNVIRTNSYESKLEAAEGAGARKLLPAVYRPCRFHVRESEREGSDSAWYVH